MANDVPITAGVGTAVATEQDATTLDHYQKVKVADGTTNVAPPTLKITAQNAAKVDGSAVTQPVSISGAVAVTGTFWQATQPISGSVSVSNFPATQPVSAAALPLPSGASTEATLALIKAKTDNLDVALSSRTKPADTQAVSAATLPLPTGAAVEGGNLATIAAKDFATSAKQDTLDTDLKAEIGTLSATPAAYTVLDRLYQIGLKLDKQQGVLQGILTALAKPPALPSKTTLLHR